MQIRTLWREQREGSLVARILVPREDDILANQHKQTCDDIPFSVALEQSGISTNSMEDPSTMLRCLDADALARRLDASRLPDESPADLLTRVLPQELIVWPADRF